MVKNLTLNCAPLLWTWNDGMRKLQPSIPPNSKRLWGLATNGKRLSQVLPMDPGQQDDVMSSWILDFTASLLLRSLKMKMSIFSSKKIDPGELNQYNNIYSIVALSGLGGHAFGSFKERTDNHMWLRDDLPNDFPHARILIYGYDTKLEDSQSIQDLEAIASTFRTALKIARPKGSVSAAFPISFRTHIKS